MTKTEDLKACPFCDGKMFLSEDDEPQFYFTCSACLISFSICAEGGREPSRSEAFRKINTRPTVTPTDGDAERCLREMATVQCAGDAADFLDAWELTIKAALQLTRKPPVPAGTIAVPREVLQGVRENLELIANVYTNDQHIPADTEAANALHGSLSHCDDLARQALASLDAVLSEGKNTQ